MSAQTKPLPYIKPCEPNVIIDINGNYRERVDVNTGKLYIDKNNLILPVFQTKTGKLYVVTGISTKTGKPKRKYLKL